MQHERRREIIEKIKNLKTIKVQDLMTEHRVSIETIRRDLEFLEEKGYLQRVYGGAILPEYYNSTEPEYEHRGLINSREKRAIGKLAASLINNGDSLFIGYGTTTIEMVRQLGDRKNLTVITNAVLIAQELVKIAKNAGSWRVILLGGEIREDEFTVSGALTESNLKNFFVSKALIGLGGIGLQSGLTDYYLQEVIAHRIVIEQAKEVIALADHSKFETTTLNRVCPADTLTALVTDWRVSETVLDEYRALGIKVYTTEEEKYEEK